MQQTTCYLIVGNGCLAKHFCHYLKLLQLPYVRWCRADGQEHLFSKLDLVSHILVLISDDQIDTFIADHRLTDLNKLLVHCSGALVSQYALSAHPLQTFGPELYDLADYQKIAFVIEAEGPDFQKLLPGLPNQSYAIKCEQKPFYHALCVMANNMTTLVWQRVFKDFETEFDIPGNAIFPILEQTFKNVKHDYRTALTGPLKRGDTKTLQKNLESLSGHPFEHIFKAVIESQLI